MAKKAKKTDLAEKAPTKFANIAFKTAFIPASNEQRQKLEQGFGTARFAFNWALSTWEANRASGQKNSFMGLRNTLNSIKRELFPWMTEVPKDIPAEAIRDLSTAFKNFFDKGTKAKYPKRKKKGKAKFSFRLPGDRLRYREAIRDDGTAVTEVYLSTIGWVQLREPLIAVGRIVYVTVSRRADQYFASFCMEYEPIKHTRRVTKPMSVGIDLGLVHTLTLSSGVKIESPRSLSRFATQLAKANRLLHRKVKGSNNRRRAARNVARLHRRIANIRRDFTEKATTNLLRAYDIIGVEDLNVAGLLKSGRFSKSLSDSALGGITAALHRKATKYGCLVTEIDRFFPSSKKCRKCQVKNHDLTLADRMFHCSSPTCDHKEDRDIHAAKNIHHEALSQLPRATGEATPVEIWSIPTELSGPVGKPSRRSRKRMPRGAVTSNTVQRQNPSESAQHA